MKLIEREGKSTSSIISAFMKEFGYTLENFKFEVTEEGKSGFLNLFGGKPTKVTFMVPDVNDKMESFTRTFLQLVEIQCKDVRVTVKDNTHHVSIVDASDAGFLIGKDARFLDSMQHLLNQMVNKAEKKQHRMMLDVDGYRKRRIDALTEKVKSIAEKVKKNGRSITLEPLHASHRRIVHQLVENDKEIRTMTIGEGEYKRVVILPANKSKGGSRPPQRRRTRRPKPADK